MKQLDYINEVLEKHTAFSFAEQRLVTTKEAALQRGDNYHEYMKQVFSGVENPTINECENNAKMQFISEYGKFCELLSGWQRSGSLFILDKRNKFVLFLYKKDTQGHSAISHYNPLNYDCIEWAMSNERFFKGLENGDFDISTDEKDIINECDLLIANE